jgi:hypothetical protein
MECSFCGIIKSYMALIACTKGGYEIVFIAAAQIAIYKDHSIGASGLYEQ